MFRSKELRKATDEYDRLVIEYEQATARMLAVAMDPAATTAELRAANDRVGEITEKLMNARIAVGLLAGTIAHDKRSA